MPITLTVLWRCNLCGAYVATNNEDRIPPYWEKYRIASVDSPYEFRDACLCGDCLKRIRREPATEKEQSCQTSTLAT